MKIWVAILIFAYALTHKAHADNQLNIHQVCKTNPSLCLELLPVELEKLTPRSNAWYKLKMYQLDSLFVLQKVQQQRVVLSALQPLNSAPVTFQITAYIHLAKNLYFHERFDESEKYTNKAVELINKVTKSYPDPLRLVSLVNIKLYNAKAKYQRNDSIKYKEMELEALAALKSIQAKFKNAYDPIFNRELYGNLGHLYNSLSKNTQALQAYKTSLFWALQIDDKQQIGVSRYNVARSYQRLENFDKALSEFKKSKQMATLINDKVNVLHCDFHIAAIYYELSQYEQMHKHLNKLDGEALSESLSLLVNELKNKVSIIEK